jgi:hypothetical protein
MQKSCTVQASLNAGAEGTRGWMSCTVQDIFARVAAFRGREKSCTVQAFLPLALLLATANPAILQAAEAPPPARTVTWFADHPKDRARVQLACLDDPGRLGRTPDCINAHQASVTVALREARQRGGLLDPRTPAYWTADPEARRTKLTMCRRNPELANCSPARRSLELEAGLAGR